MAKAWQITTEKDGATVEHPPCLGLPAALRAIGLGPHPVFVLTRRAAPCISLIGRHAEQGGAPVLFRDFHGFDIIAIRRAPEFDDSLHASAYEERHPSDARVVNYTAGVSLIRCMDTSRPKITEEIILADGSRPRLGQFPDTSLALLEPSTLAQWLFLVEGAGLMATLQAARDKLGQLHAAELGQRERRRGGAPALTLGQPPACLSDAELRRRLPTIRTMISGGRGTTCIHFPKANGSWLPAYEVQGHYFRAEIHFGERVKTVQDYLAR